MKAVCRNLDTRGQRATLYLRRKIPHDLRDAYAHNKREIVRGLGTSDVASAIAERASGTRRSSGAS